MSDAIDPITKMPIEVGYGVTFKPTIWHRLGFGHAYVAPWDEDDDPRDGHEVNYLVSEIVIVLDWRDRVRCLLTGRLNVYLRNRTQHPAGRVEGRSAVKVMGWGWGLR